MVVMKGGRGSDPIRDAPTKNISISFVILSETVKSRKTALGLFWLHYVSGNLEKI
jgi:hypothetical protein